LSDSAWFTYQNSIVILAVYY